MRTETSRYRLCRAGQDLLAAIDRAYPKRDHSSDGWVGDSSHAARRSDHNVNWSYRPGIVKALDIDKDLRSGRAGDFNAMVEAIRVQASRGDSRFRGGYIIWNRSICSSKTGWRWARYTGVNGHTAHAHFSFADVQSCFDARGAWPVRGFHEPNQVSQPGHVHRQDVFRLGSVHSVYVRDVQGHINYWRTVRGLSKLLPDGKFGPATKYCVEVIQQAYGMTRDGVVGPATWRILHSSTGGKRLESDGRGF